MERPGLDRKGRLPVTKKVAREKSPSKVALPVPVVSKERVQLHAQAIHVELVLENARKVLVDPNADPVKLNEAMTLASRMHERLRTFIPQTNGAHVQFMECLQYAVDASCVGEADTDLERARMAWNHFTQVCPEYHLTTIDAEFRALLTAAFVAWRDNAGMARVSVARAIKQVFDVFDPPLKPASIQDTIKKFRRAQRPTP